VHRGHVGDAHVALGLAAHDELAELGWLGRKEAASQEGLATSGREARAWRASHRVGERALEITEIEPVPRKIASACAYLERARGSAPGVDLHDARHTLQDRLHTEGGDLEQLRRCARR
jgi:hypothetical protein